MWFSATLEQG